MTDAQHTERLRTLALAGVAGQNIRLLARLRGMSYGTVCRALYEERPREGRLQRLAQILGWDAERLARDIEEHDHA